ncbi:MAG: tRNA (adenosine(37)-N6)-dimethylallyltransferase MiaA [bacterium]
MSEPLPKLLVIGGPTATGKTGLAKKLAKDFNGVIINADSRQIYRFMNIGTDKGQITPTKETLLVGKQLLQCFELADSAVLGWLFDLVDPDQYFSLNDYQILVKALLNYLWNQGKFPIIVGGTGLYLDAIIKNYQLPQVQPDFVFRKQLELLTVEQLQQKYQQDTGQLAVLNESDRFNPRRLIRLIEAGKFPKLVKTKSSMNFSYLFLYPKFAREKLAEKIQKRVEEMLKEGWVDEVKQLITMGYQDSPLLRGIGYQNVVQYLHQELTEAELIKAITLGHLQYAKRQITWFTGKSRNYALQQFDFTDDFQLIIQNIQKFLKQ